MLRDFFSREDVPAHLLRYKNLFVYQQVQQEVGLGEDFDARILAQVETPVVKAKRLTLTGRFIPLFKAAAVIAIMVRKKKSTIVELVMLMHEKNHFAVVNFTGNMSPEFIAQIKRHFHLL